MMSSTNNNINNNNNNNNISSTSDEVLEISHLKRTSILNDFVTNNDLFGCLLVSQLETVDAVSQLDKQFSSIVNKTILVENLVGITMNKYSAMEETMRAFMQQFENLNLSHFSSSSLSLTKQQQQEQQQTEQLPPASPLESLVEVCSDLLEKENDPNDAIEVEKNRTTEANLELKNELIKDEKSDFICAEHSACFYCKAHSKYLLADQKPALSTSSFDNNNNESHEFKEVQRQFNKRVKYEVNKKFGSFYLADHQVRELDVKEMHRIRKKVMRLFTPFPIPIKVAWNNAMNSLRQDRHQLNKKKRYLYRK